MTYPKNIPPHPLDSHGQWLLLEIAESANPPEILPSGPEWGEREMPARDGWKVVFFYDGELDYIDHFVSPNGARLEVWPEECAEREQWDNGWPPLMNWRGVGDLARLREAYGEAQ